MARSQPTNGQKTRIAIAGFGLVGRRHAAAIGLSRSATLVSVVDPSKDVAAEVTSFGARYYQNLADLMSDDKPDGIILSTPTKLHVEQAIECVKAGVPILIEKPISDDLDAAAKLVADAKRAGVPILVGHHRRFNPIIRQAKNLIAHGKIGELRAVHATCWFYKPDDYFEEAPWRKQKGAGPISVNLVHDVDLLRYLGGEIECVQAQTVPSKRGFENEDLAGALLRFEQGALGTLSVSDSVVSPWSWELTANEFPIYPATDQSTYLFGGSEGALSVPDLRLWRHEGRADWWSPISATYYPTEASDPLVNQLDHFVEVIAERVTPLVSGEEGLLSLRVVDAIQNAARSGKAVTLRTSKDQ